MQRPRRTSEFYEELPTSNLRQSRQRSTIAPSPAPGTAKKYATRQSRVPVSTRPSSMDRAMERNPYINLPPNSAQRGQRSVSTSGAPTPQKTPLGKSPGTRVIFTAEKHRGGGAMHSDKRWVNEQVVRITEYLVNDVVKGAIPGITPDFFSARTGGLRHMSVKQFVAIVNYFLHFIVGNRFKVGVNYVEDMINILQKLQYPHQLNKSWLKTPNTPHSFSNVMLLLDFFMDFVDPRDSDLETGFPFAVPEEYTLNQTETDCQRMPDVEFQAQLVRHTEEAFMLWDKSLDADVIQIQTCDLLVQKRCNIESLAALTEANKQLEQQLVELEQQRPQLRKQDEEQCNKMSEELKYILRAIQMTSDDLETETKQLKQLQSRLPLANEDVHSLESEIAEINAEIDRQMYSLEKRDALMDEVIQHKHMLKSQERAVRDLSDCDHHQRVILSRTKNQLREQVQKFNTHIHEIAYFQLHSISPTDDLQLSISATHKDLQRIAPTIKSLRKKAEARVKTNSATLQQLEQQIIQLTHEIEASLNPNMTVLSSKVAATKQNLQQYKELVAKERSSLEIFEAEVEQHFQKSKTSVEEYAATLVEKDQKVKNLVKENEETMSSKEEKYYECANAREAYLDEYAATMEQANAELQTLSDIVESNQQLIDRHKHQSAENVDENSTFLSIAGM